ncbi:hypothetical protein AVEN_109909-1 [Araneus ventricosus]|uniref:Uncharacterized protein n=1 Tax=Araneus ventricosus TaxID=182803 RepID=A0A4Y2GTT3_ARAVE|nr:hypothetical protein AVEN_109909-1 [Araneus ventricosus]
MAFTNNKAYDISTECLAYDSSNSVKYHSHQLHVTDKYFASLKLYIKHVKLTAKGITADRQWCKGLAYIGRTLLRTSSLEYSSRLNVNDKYLTPSKLYIKHVKPVAYKENLCGVANITECKATFNESFEQLLKS